MKEFNVSRSLSRQAIGLLRAEGLVYTEHGRATFVRPKLPIRRLGGERYRADATRARDLPPGTSFTRDQAIGWESYQLDRNFAEVPATSAIAELLGVEPGVMLLERRFVFRSHGYPQQMSTSYLPLDLVAGTPIADPNNEPWPGGTIAQMHTLGAPVTAVEEQVRARMPVDDERATLRIPEGVPVLTITRRMFAGDRVVEAAVDIVIPADRVVLDYRIDL